MLVCLYSLLDFVVEHGAFLMIDEPECHLGLPEIQPWLMELRDALEGRGAQVVLVSHHPELIDYLAPEIGLVFERPGAGPVRVRQFTVKPGATLSPSELIARGWSNE